MESTDDPERIWKYVERVRKIVQTVILVVCGVIYVWSEFTVEKKHTYDPETEFVIKGPKINRGPCQQYSDILEESKKNGM